jgi:tRNA-Thr(GGU) m(6)t(6)A37 methyltransferase TsaA
MRLKPIGRLRTPWRTIAACPRNGRQPEAPPLCLAAVDPAWRAALIGLDGFTHLILLYWLGSLQGRGIRPVPTLRPPFDPRPRGVFATRSPCRPNPIGVSVVRFEGFAAPGQLWVRYLDCRDGTPLLDIKPYLPTTDAEPEASMGWLARQATRKLSP